MAKKLKIKIKDMKLFIKVLKDKVVVDKKAILDENILKDIYTEFTN